MAGACVTVQVEPESVLADRSFLNTRGEPLAWLDVGDRGELALYGAPDALLRLAAGLIATADRAERLADDRRNAAAPGLGSFGVAWAGGGGVVMAIDDLLDRARDARRRRDEAAGELVALVRALEGLEGVGMLDATQKRELGRVRERPRAKHNGGRRATKRSAAVPR